jgi:hypothetical protein
MQVGEQGARSPGLGDGGGHALGHAWEQRRRQQHALRLRRQLRQDLRAEVVEEPPGGGVGRAGGVDGTLHLGQTGAAPWNRSAP